MTDAELVSAIQGSIVIIQGNREYALTVLTGYLLIIYFVGEKLTRFQLAFVNAVYSLVFFYSAAGNYKTGDVLDRYRQIVNEQNPELVQRLGLSGNTDGANEIELFFTILIYVGSILFMWSIRSSKKE